MPGLHTVTSSHLSPMLGDVLLSLDKEGRTEEEGNMEGKAVLGSGFMLGSLRWDSGWQGGNGRRKRKKRRKGAGEAERDITTFDSHEKQERRGRR